MGFTSDWFIEPNIDGTKKGRSTAINSPSDLFGSNPIKDNHKELIKKHPFMLDTKEERAFLESQNGEFKYPWLNYDGVAPPAGVPQAVHMLDNIWGFDPRRMSAGEPSVFMKKGSDKAGAEYGRSITDLGKAAGEGNWNPRRLGIIGLPDKPVEAPSLGHEFFHQGSSAMPYISGRNLINEASDNKGHGWSGPSDNSNNYSDFLMQKGYIPDPLVHTGNSFSRTFKPQTMFNDFSKEIKTRLPEVRDGISRTYADLVAGAMTDPISLENSATRLAADHRIPELNAIKAARAANIGPFDEEAIKYQDKLIAESKDAAGPKYWYSTDEMASRNVGDYTNYWIDPDYDLNNPKTGSLSDDQYWRVDDFMSEMESGY